MATQEKTWNVANRLHSQKDSDNPEVNHIIAGADEIYDDAKGAKQSDINAQTGAALANRYTKAETYSKAQLDSMITTPDVNYVTVATFAELPQTGESDTVYRVSSYDGVQVDVTKYALYAWDGTTYQLLAVRSAIGEVVDVSEVNSGATYADLPAALAAVPESVKRGGMSIKFIQRTNTGTQDDPVYNDEYVQYRYMGTSIAIADFTNTANWQGVDDEPTPGSRNLVESGGIAEVYGKYKDDDEWVYTLTDKDSKFIFGIKKDGSIEWSVGVPTPIQKLVNSIVIGTDGVNIDGLNKIEAFLNEFSTEDSLKALLDAKVNTEEGKGLIPSQYVEEVDNSEMLQQVLDAAGRVIESTHVDGTKEINWNLKVGGDFETPNRKETTEDSGYVKVLLDANNKVIMGVGGDGDVVFGKVPSQIQRLIDEKEDKHEGGDDPTNKLMKVVINAVEGVDRSNAFYIRTKYNDKKDIIITHMFSNNGGVVCFEKTYIGGKELEDSQLLSDAYLVSNHSDSISPLKFYTQYWHLFANHGYPVPYIANNVGMTSADVGAEWKDQLNRHYTVGDVTNDYIYLMPVIYQDSNGHYTRDWHSTAISTTITELTHVSGGVYSQDITVTSVRQQQLEPIVKTNNRIFVIDGHQIYKSGVYYCNDFKISEIQTGYDPATINNWFSGTSKIPDLTNAEPMAEFTYSINYIGANCSVNTTIHCIREAKGDYGGTQQQFFFDNGNYKAMFLIPKAAVQNGVELDKPFNSPSSTSQGYSIYRNSSGLKDVDDPVDRQIGMLYNPTDNTYLVGMAAGLSLVSGDTVKDKRNQICLEGCRLLIFSPSNTNKFYISATNTSAFESGYYPVGYFKEVNYYVSYFDPAENEGQVYWYKDGNSFIIYAHCQDIHKNLAINVPYFMEGLKLSVVERTSNSELLTDTIQNGKFFVNYTTNDANYIVLKTN